MTREEAIKDIQENIKPFVGGKSLDMAIEALAEAEPKHGRWKQVEVVHDRKDAKIQDWQQAQCSVCGRWHTTPFMYYLKLDNYCPNCGANMREVEE